MPGNPIFMEPYGRSSSYLRLDWMALTRIAGMAPIPGRFSRDRHGVCHLPDSGVTGLSFCDSDLATGRNGCQSRTYSSGTLLLVNSTSPLAAENLLLWILFGLGLVQWSDSPGFIERNCSVSYRMAECRSRDPVGKPRCKHRISVLQRFPMV